MTGKSYTLGKCDYNDTGRKNCTARLIWSLEEGRDGKVRFSMSGEIWRPDEHDLYAGGQCVDTVAALFPDDAKAQRMAEIWKRWHLNDMRPGCAHQQEWDTKKELVLQKFTWSGKFHATRKAAEDGTLPVEEYAHLKEISARVMKATIAMNAPKYAEHSEVKVLLAEGWIEPEKKTETKRAGWVYPAEHPDGVLCKPCPTCGYVYGSKWVYEEIPADVLAEIRSW